VLIVGCGNSELSAAMADDGFTDVVSIDYSAVVIDKMIDTYKQHKPQLQCQQRTTQRGVVSPSPLMSCCAVLTD